MNEMFVSERLPVLPLRGLTVFPHMMMHFDVGREKSVAAVHKAMSMDQRMFLVTQRDILVDDPGKRDLYDMGTIVRIKQILKMPGDTMRILVEGIERAELQELEAGEQCLFGRVQTVMEPEVNGMENRIEALRRQSFQLYDELLMLTQKPPQENLIALFTSGDPGALADHIGQNATFGYAEKMKVLKTLHPVKRLEIANRLLAHELQILRIEDDLNEKVQDAINKGQRDYYLREQMKVIRSELGDDEEEEFAAYERKIRALKLPQESEEKLLKEVGRLEKQPSGSSEAALIRNYLDTCLELPWNKTTKETVDIEKARKILDADHFGLEKVKERILEFLAVKKLKPDYAGQIICLVGPPGVGKTSVAFSIARCLNRKLSRIALGGVHDEADIRGHRKTYIGAMPGRIMAGIQQAGTKNPLLLLDEIDKMGADYRGDPSAALLEVLDAEQNATFRDHYLELPFDLSQCMFITTANTLDTIPRALLDRMEVIELGSYTDEEKLMIAKQHLLPKQLKRHGVKRTQLRMTDEAIREAIVCYTRESGVRNLERELGKVCRKAAMQLAGEEAPKRLSVSGKNIEEFLGPRKFLPDKLPSCDSIGLVTGLAWTSVGGETLEVEVNVMEGSGKLELTGNLGDVMKESAQAAMSYIRSRAEQLHIAPDFYKTKDIHVHFPEGAVPKDGPSAGITVCTAMVSALTGLPVRRDIAMTGEISIRGRVLPIGGLREKTMAALRHGIHTVIIPRDNEKDLEEIDQTVRRALNFIPVDHVDSVLQAALELRLNDAKEVASGNTDCLSIAIKEAPKKPQRGIRQ
ncbi:MAG: endopeptidase La [Ruminococcaceae bacterium]|nr:endopeptidase La [Oscillospiraceae bacterium]